MSWPFSFSIAAAQASSVANSTNANPRDLPVSRSIPMRAFTTGPASENSCLSSSSVAEKLRLPTNAVLDTDFPFSSPSKERGPGTGAASTLEGP